MSWYKTHSYKSSLNEKNARDEMEISKNGPSEFRAEKLNGNGKVFETKFGKWHFARQSNRNLINFGVEGSGNISTTILKQASEYPMVYI